MKDAIIIKKFSDINLDDPFFGTLKDDYKDFEKWFKKKSEEEAYVQYDDSNNLQAFLYLKDESEEIDQSIIPIMSHKKRLKIGTFKIDAHDTKLGQRFIKKIFDVAIYSGFEEIYVTIFQKYDLLIDLLCKYGFYRYGNKGDELVFVKDLSVKIDDILKRYPIVRKTGVNKYLLSIYPDYHTLLFPDSILRNEEVSRDCLIKDVSHTNSIHKVYISFISKTTILNRGDILVIYRTNDSLGPARYRSVVTSIFVVEEVKSKTDFRNLDDYLNYSKKYSVFSNENLKRWFFNDKFVVIKMTYNVALSKRITRGELLDEARISPNMYWGFFQLTDEQFEYILKKGKVNECFIVD